MQMVDSMTSSQKNQPIALNYDLFIFALTLFSYIVVVGIAWPGNPQADMILYWSDAFICIIFLIDFLFLLLTAPNKTDYFLRQGGWLDIIGAIATVPGHPWTAVFRLARLNRLIHINKRLQGIDEREKSKTHWGDANTVLLTTILIAIILVTVGSMLILRAERHAPHAEIISGKTAIWWAIVTMTTVGYGDFVPVTDSGRLLALCLMVFGIGVFAVLTSFIASKFVASERDDSDLIAKIIEENSAIQAELLEIKQLLQQQKDVGQEGRQSTNPGKPK